MIIDAHQHFWQLSKPFQYDWLRVPQHAPICRDYLPEHLKPLMDAAGVERSIFVQTQHNIQENRWVLGLAAEYPFIAGVVGWVDLAGADCEKQIEEFKPFRKFVGVRHVVQDEPDDDWIIRPQVLRGLKLLEKHNIPFDLLFFVKHLKHAATLGRLLPNLPMVINHLAKPRIREQHIDGWREDLQAAAAFPNIHCKLSGLVTEADWQHWKAADLKPYIDIALEAFGPDRCMFGSDWPVCELAGSYGQVHQALIDTLGPISASEKAAIFGGTAARFYRLAD